MERYVVRVWVPATATDDTAEPAPGLHGVVRHVSSGRSETFRDGCELLRRLVELRATALPDRAPPTATVMD